MARLIPSAIDASTDSERIFLEELQKQLPANVEIYHNLRYRTEDRHDEGEADVILLSPDLGMMVIEVKGGVVTYADNRWTVSSSKGDRVVDPVSQCMQTIQFFEKRLRAEYGRVPVRISYAVATPYTTFAPGADLHGHEHILIDGSHMQVLAKRIHDIATARNTVAVENPAALEKLRAILNPIFDVGVSLNTKLAGEEGSLIRLTTAQEIAWTTMRGSETRALVKGPAGTGKTVIALAHAISMAQSGKKTLLVCFNKALQLHLQAVIAERGYDDLPLEVHTIDSIAYRLCEKMHCNDLSRGEFVRHIEHDRTLTVADTYDVVIVDEGQDITESGWMLILDLLNDQDALVVFYDPSQELYDDHGVNATYIEENLAFDAKTGQKCSIITLKQNVRNAEPIVHSLRKSGIDYDHAPDCPVKEDGVRVLEAKGDPWSVLDARVKHLVKTEGLRPEQIVVLTLNEDASCTKGKQYVGDTPVIREPEGRAGRVRICSVGKFKGLEADIVFVVDAEKKSASRRAAWEYVAVSRGKHRVFVIA